MKVTMIQMSLRDGVSDNGKGNPYKIFEMIYLRPVHSENKSAHWTLYEEGMMPTKSLVPQDSAQALWDQFKLHNSQPCKIEITTEEKTDREYKLLSVITEATYIAADIDL